LSELRVPTQATTAEVRCDDGRILVGRVFIPATASHHTGAMRPHEWLNEGAPFFAFLADESKSTVLLNKQQVAVLTIAPEIEVEEQEKQEDVVVRLVAVDVGDRRIQGRIVIDMPENARRVLDALNQPEAFVTIRGEGRWHLVRKSLITRVVEIEEL
jgi:hypothetical protein